MGTPRGRPAVGCTPPLAGGVETDFGATPMSRASAAANHPHQRRQQERQLEADAAGAETASDHPDVVAHLEGRAVDPLATEARFDVPERDARLLGPVNGTPGPLLQDYVRYEVCVTVCDQSPTLSNG